MWMSRETWSDDEIDWALTRLSHNFINFWRRQRKMFTQLHTFSVNYLLLLLTKSYFFICHNFCFSHTLVLSISLRTLIPNAPNFVMLLLCCNFFRQATAFETFFFHISYCNYQFFFFFSFLDFGWICPIYSTLWVRICNLCLEKNKVILTFS